MKLKSEELAELIDKTLSTYQYDDLASSKFPFSKESLCKISYSLGDEKLENCSYTKLNNGIVFQTLSSYGHGCNNNTDEMVVVNGTFEGDNFYFHSAIRIYSRYFNETFSAEITPIEPKIDTEVEDGKNELEKILMRSFETIGYKQQEIRKVINKVISPFDLFKKFMFRTGRWANTQELVKPRHTQVFANADNSNSIKVAKKNGAEGIGLVRIENMNGTSANDFLELFRATGNLPISIRLLLEDEHGNKKANLLDYKILLDNICTAAYDTLPNLTIVFPAEILEYKETDEENSLCDQLYSYRLANYNFSIGAIIENPSEELYKNLDIEILDSLCFGTNDISAKLYGYKRNGKEIALQKEASILTPKVKDILKSHILRVKKRNYSCIFGVCGYHASIPENIDAFQDLGMDYLSCVPKEIQIIKSRLPQTHQHNKQEHSADEER